MLPTVLLSLPPSSAAEDFTPPVSVWADNNCTSNWDRAYAFYLDEHPDTRVDIDHVTYVDQPIRVEADTALAEFFTRDYDENGDPTGTWTLYNTETLQYPYAECPAPGRNNYSDHGGTCDPVTGLTRAPWDVVNGADDDYGSGPDSTFHLTATRSDGLKANQDGYTFTGVPTATASSSIRW